MRRVHHARARRSGPQTSYVGPAAIVNAHRFIFDSRDDAAEERLEILADQDGVWRCRTIFNCVDACPRGINITRAILEVSRARPWRRAPDAPIRHAARAGRDPGRWRVAQQPRPGRVGRGDHRRLPARTPRPDAPAVARISRPLGIQTNNYAEYMGVILALEKALALGAREVELVLDSMLIVEQLSGRWKVKHPAIRPLAARADGAAGRPSIAGRSATSGACNNMQADAMANLALDDPAAAAAAERGGAY